jgi:hypothetical protein
MMFDDAKGFPFGLYRCTEGCFHLIWGHVVLRFTPSQFAFFVKALQGALEQMGGLKEEAERATDEFIM